jgi:hypothetical protein
MYKSLTLSFAAVSALAGLSASAASFSSTQDYRPGGTPGGGVKVVDGFVIGLEKLLVTDTPGEITQVTVELDLTKSADSISSNGTATGTPGDLVNSNISISLLSPDSISVLLIKPNIYSDVEDVLGITSVILFDDDALSTVGGSTITSGTFQPFGSLSSFDGEIAEGTWSLIFSDSGLGSPLSINSWTLNIETDAQAIPSPTTAVMGSIMLLGLVSRRRRRA